MKSKLRFLALIMCFVLLLNVSVFAENEGNSGTGNSSSYTEGVVDDFVVSEQDETSGGSGETTVTEEQQDVTASSGEAEYNAQKALEEFNRLYEEYQNSLLEQDGTSGEVKDKLEDWYERNEENADEIIDWVQNGTDPEQPTETPITYDELLEIFKNIYDPDTQTFGGVCICDSECPCGGGCEDCKCEAPIIFK